MKEWIIGFIIYIILLECKIKQKLITRIVSYGIFFTGQDHIEHGIRSVYNLI